MALMQLIFLKRALPKECRGWLRATWNSILEFEQFYAERRFYRQFIKKGDLVFDIGANTGTKTRAFLSLGARVVAVEPNPVCAGLIRQHYEVALAHQRLYVQECAVASERGKLMLRVFGERGAMTTGSGKFERALEAAGNRSTSTIQSETTTADDLVARFGLPVLIKIDVEGMDVEVLRGLHHRPRFTSFEFNTTEQLWEITLLCFSEAARLGFTQGNFSASGTPKFILNRWCDLGSLPVEITRWAMGRQTYGDVVLR